MHRVSFRVSFLANSSGSTFPNVKLSKSEVIGTFSELRRRRRGRL